MEVRFTHPRLSDTYLADVSPLLTARQALEALHASFTGPFLPPLEHGESERLILRRIDKVIPLGDNMASAGVVENDVLDVVCTGRTPEKHMVSDTDLNYVGLFIAKRKYLVGSIQEDFQEHVRDCIRNYVKLSHIYRNIHYGLQIIIVAGASTIPVFLSISQIPSWFPAITSGIVAFATAVANLFRFGEKSHNTYLTAENMQREYNRFMTKRDPYKDLGDKDSFNLFMDKIEAIGHEHIKSSLSLEKFMENQKMSMNK